MRTVYLMRHAKSRWDEPDVPDEARGLTKRGKRDAKAIGEGMALQEAPPHVIVTSIARRARGTARRMAGRWGYAGQIVTDARLWEGGPHAILSLLREMDDGVHSVLLIGHNPSMEETVFLLGDRVVSMATSTVVRIDLPVDSWAELQLPAYGTVQHVWIAEKAS